MHRTILCLAGALLASSTKIDRTRTIPSFIPSRRNDRVDEAEAETEAVSSQDDEIPEDIEEECTCPSQP